MPFANQGCVFDSNSRLLGPAPQPPFGVSTEEEVPEPWSLPVASAVPYCHREEFGRRVGHRNVRRSPKVLGFVLVDQDANGAYLTTRFDHHSVVITSSR